MHSEDVSKKEQRMVKRKEPKSLTLAETVGKQKGRTEGL
jgi:hypothetical protein